MAVLLTLAGPIPQSLALSGEETDSTEGIGSSVSAETDADTDADADTTWTADEGSEVWGASLRAGGSEVPLGYSSSVGGSLSDADFTWGATDYTVTSVLPTDSGGGSDSTAATLSSTFDPALCGAVSALRLKVGDVGLNVADASVDGADISWHGADASWESGDVVSLSLEEFPTDFTPPGIRRAPRERRRQQLSDPVRGGRRARQRADRPHRHAHAVRA